MELEVLDELELLELDELELLELDLLEHEQFGEAFCGKHIPAGGFNVNVE